MKRVLTVFLTVIFIISSLSIPAFADEVELAEIGDIVEIKKAGEIIPEVLKSVEKTEDSTPINIPMVVGVMKEVNIKGAIAYTVSEFETCIKMLAEKKINVTKYIDDLVSLEKAQESFERLTSGKDSAIKIILKPLTIVLRALKLNIQFKSMQYTYSFYVVDLFRLFIFKFDLFLC